MLLLLVCRKIQKIYRNIIDKDKFLYNHEDHEGHEVIERSERDEDKWMGDM